MTKAVRLVVLGVCLGSVNSCAWATDYSSTILYTLNEPQGVDGINATPHITDGMTIGSGHIPEAHGSQNYALVWAASGAVTSLNPGSLGFVNSVAAATDGISQVGSGAMSAAVTSPSYALLWTGTADSAINLNPTGYLSSAANGVSGNQQVGKGVYSDGSTQALLWTGTAQSAVSLNPPGDNNCIATATDGVNQVGYDNSGALLWSGTAASAVKLAPTDIPNVWSSIPLDVSGNQQVGYILMTGGAEHAIVWNGSAASAVDLNPAGFAFSEAFATNGTTQVGSGQTNVGAPLEAMLWTGSADSAVNLQLFLPDGGANTNSIATSIDSAGNVFGIAHGTINNVSGYFAVEWSPVPEPGSGAVLTVLAIARLLLRYKPL